jgi:hypothetical protein
MTTRSSAIAPPPPDAVEDTPALVQERRDRLVKYFEDCRVRIHKTYVPSKVGLIL